MRAARTALVACVLVVLAGASIVQAQTSPGADASRLRTLFFNRDYETGVIDGMALAAGSSDSSELKAWPVLNLGRAEPEAEELERAWEMKDSTPNDVWSWSALAGALHYKGDQTAEANEASAKAVAIAPDKLLQEFSWRVEAIRSGTQ